MAYLVIDLEMTGGDPSWHEIIQIGACLFDHNWELKGKYLQNVYPENEESFSMPAYEVHGLSLDELNDAPMMYDVLPAFENWIIETLAGHKNVPEWDRAKYLKRVRICGQSILGDVNFLQFAYRHEKMKWPFSYKLLDLLNLSFFLFKILRANDQATPKSQSLDAVSEFFGYERTSDIHNAQEDALLTGYCLRDVMAYCEKLELKEK
ncbi:MAG: 3'-5' exonuclease [Saprospiraceae bacterium]|nr:3'-5' exonuclease [Saprospiraceae bacterium]